MTSERDSGIVPGADFGDHRAASYRTSVASESSTFNISDESAFRFTGVFPVGVADAEGWTYCVELSTVLEVGAGYRVQLEGVLSRQDLRQRVRRVVSLPLTGPAQMDRIGLMDYYERAVREIRILHSAGDPDIVDLFQPMS